MAKAITGKVSQQDQHHAGAQTASELGWAARMSNHIAYALLVYTGLQIFVVMAEMKGDSHSMLPYLGLVLLIALIIPACRRFEKRWEAIDAGVHEDAQGDIAALFRRDRLALWLAAIGLPMGIAGLWHLGSLALG